VQRKIRVARSSAIDAGTSRSAITDGGFRRDPRSTRARVGPIGVHTWKSAVGVVVSAKGSGHTGTQQGWLVSRGGITAESANRSRQRRVTIESTSVSFFSVNWTIRLIGSRRSVDPLRSLAVVAWSRRLLVSSERAERAENVGRL
jgi:hypothetical protein